jgi:hypothetical protein
MLRPLRPYQESNPQAGLWIPLILGESTRSAKISAANYAKASNKKVPNL